MAELDDFDDDDDFPVLNNVGKAGDPALIRAAKATQQAIQQPVSNTSPLTPAALSRSITAPIHNARRDLPRFSSDTSPLAKVGDRQLEKLIDEVIDRHSDEIRREIHSLLARRE